MGQKLKKTFESLEEAMSLLPERTLKHCERVREYMTVLFLQACTEEIYETDPKTQARLKVEYRDLVGLIGYYHDIGKAMIPEEYHSPDSELSDVEIKLYEDHVDTSAALIKEHFKVEHQYKAYEQNYAREAIAFHHERWDGNGFPNKTKGKDIPLFSRMIFLIDTMDHWICETHSEHPFDDAMDRIKEESGKMFDPVLVEVLKLCQPKLRKIYLNDIDQTNVIMPIVPFVKHTAKSMISLFYRPVETRGETGTFACEAFVKFHRGHEWVKYEDVQTILKLDLKTKRNLGIYAALEACDMIRRLDICQLKNEYLMLNLPAGIVGIRGYVNDVNQALQDSGVKPEKLVMVVNSEDLGKKRSQLEQNIKKFIESGIKVMISRATLCKKKDEYEEGEITPEAIIALGADKYRINKEEIIKRENEPEIALWKKLMDAGIELFEEGNEPGKGQNLLNYLKVKHVTGALEGMPVLADDYVKAELATLNK